MSLDLIPAVICALVFGWAAGRFFQAWADRFQVEVITEQLRIQRLKTATLKQQLESRR